MLHEVISVMKKTEPEIEFLPPRSRYQCQECGKRLSRNLIKNKRTGKSVCRNCNRNLGTNIFYCPKIRPKRDFVGKYSLSSSEMNVLKSSQVKRVSKWLNTLKDKKTKQHGSDEENQAKKKINEEFLMGLGQK